MYFGIKFSNPATVIPQLHSILFITNQSYDGFVRNLMNK